MASAAVLSPAVVERDDLEEPTKNRVKELGALDEASFRGESIVGGLY